MFGLDEKRSDKQSLDWRKGKARLNPTVLALMRRGFDDETATRLVADDWTLAKLQQTSSDELLGLGLRLELVQTILDAERPPIPAETLAQVLVASRFICCVCRVAGRGVVVHHIAPWAKTRDHRDSNLAVLCLEDHDRAHSQLAHTQNLTPALIRKAKASWQKQVERFDVTAILTATAQDFDCWWFFNRRRLFAMANDAGTPLRELSYFRAARLDGWVNREGYLQTAVRDTNYSLEGGDGGSLYAYLTQVLESVLSRASVWNASNDLDRKLLRSVLDSGQLILVQGLFRFIENADVRRGRGQTTEMYRQANNVKLTCTFDRWEATSNSAWSCFLKGHQEAFGIFRVVSLQSLEGGDLEIKCSVLAIGAPQSSLKQREYSNAPFRRGYIPVFDEEENQDS